MKPINQIELIKSAIAALTQNKVYEADILFAINRLNEALDLEPPDTECDCYEWGAIHPGETCPNCGKIIAFIYGVDTQS